jgi:hypothetical protein
VAVRLAGAGTDLPGTVDRLLTAWTAHGPASSRDLLEDLDRPPWVEQTDEGIDVVSEGRPGTRMWKDWMVSFTSWVDSADQGVRPVAFIDRISGRTRPHTSTAPGESE